MSATSPPLGGVMVRPGLRYAWYGPALLITDSRGECGGDQGLTGFYFRETRFLRDLRLEIDGQRPWLCASGTGEQRVLAFSFSHPELRGYTGGGSGTGGEDIPRDRRGVPDRALDLLSRYELSFRGVDITVVITNRSTSEVAIDLAWCVGADFADLMEALEGGPRVEFRVTESLHGGLRYRLDQPDLGFSTYVSATGAGPWTACPGRLVARVTLPPQRPQTIRLGVVAHDP